MSPPGTTLDATLLSTSLRSSLKLSTATRCDLRTQAFLLAAALYPPRLPSRITPILSSRSKYPPSWARSGVGICAVWASPRYAFPKGHTVGDAWRGRKLKRHLGSILAHNPCLQPLHNTPVDNQVVRRYLGNETAEKLQRWDAGWFP